MQQEIFDWILLLLRWLHIVVGISWIGASIFFMWLDRTFTVDPEAKNPGHLGDLWMVHGGGFYHVEKLQMGPTKVPEHLHWFKWESYWTWMSGFALLILVFYTGGGAFLLDSSVSHLNYGEALFLGLSSLIVSWFFYDWLWEREFTRTKPMTGHVLTLLWFAGASYLLCHTLSGRAAYMHIGAMLGTWMTANVFLRIIPRQVKMVEAAKKGEPVNQTWSKNAKSRSTHNTYLTLPVIFIMLSNHFPSTYGSPWNWLILLVLSAAGALIREYFISRVQKPRRARVFAGVGIFLIVLLVLASQIHFSNGAAEGTLSVAAGATVPSGDCASCAVVKGTVKYAGTPPPQEKLQMPPGCESPDHHDVYSNEILLNKDRLANVFVHIVHGLEGKTFSDVPAETVEINQQNCIYIPRVAAARVGQKVEFINSDPVFHNVRSLSEQNENFNVAMPNKNDRVTKIFAKPEIFLQTKCSVHPWMGASIAVVEDPYFAVTNTEGEFSLPPLPPGKYTLQIWHEIFGKQSQDFEVKTEKLVNLDFTYPQAARTEK